MPGKFWDDLKEGDEFVTKGRTITEADITNFAGVSGDFNQLHTDEQFAADTIFGKRIAHGMLVLSVTTGLSQQLGIFDGTTMAFLSLEWTFKSPVFIGDTIHCAQRIASMRETRKPDRGIITLDCEVKNQNDEIVQQGKRTLMLKRRP